MSVAFVSDIHFRDLSHIEDSLRELSPMYDQVRSTRLFNENFFVLHTVLEDIVGKGIKYVVLLGDLTDNGQERNVKAVASVLEDYHRRYGIRFIAMTGNHDPFVPVGMESDGQDLLGYNEIMDCWRGLGFFPTEEDIYWESPFCSNGKPDDKAFDSASIQNRVYFMDGLKPGIADASFLVEPFPGLWLLGIDASVYLPDKISVAEDSIISFKDSSLGFANTFRYKEYLLSWISDVCNRAKEKGKTLISFSHYPLYSNSGILPDTLRKYIFNGHDLGRTSEEAPEYMADAGIRVHCSGHMHMNGTTRYVSEAGNSFINIHIPSTSGYYPAYKILDIIDGNTVDIRTVSINKVENYNKFFSWYNKELHDSDCKTWSDRILLSEDYIEYVTEYFEELVSNRFIYDYSPSLKDSIGFIGDVLKIKYGGDLAIEQLGDRRMEALTEDLPSDRPEIRNMKKALILFLEKKLPDKDFRIEFGTEGAYVKRME